MSLEGHQWRDTYFVGSEYRRELMLTKVQSLIHQDVNLIAQINRP
jgi:hypothetical protein